MTRLEDAVAPNALARTGGAERERDHGVAFAGLAVVGDRDGNSLALVGGTKRDHLRKRSDLVPAGTGEGNGKCAAERAVSDNTTCPEPVVTSAVNSTLEISITAGVVKFWIAPAVVPPVVVASSLK